MTMDDFGLSQMTQSSQSLRSSQNSTESRPSSQSSQSQSRITQFLKRGGSAATQSSSHSFRSQRPARDASPAAAVTARLDPTPAMSEDEDEQADHWVCSMCTFHNAWTLAECDMCATACPPELAPRLRNHPPAAVPRVQPPPSPPLSTQIDDEAEKKTSRQSRAWLGESKVLGQSRLVSRASGRPKPPLATATATATAAGAAAGTGTGKASVVQPSADLWVDRYRPTTEKALCVHAKKLKEVLAFVDTLSCFPFLAPCCLCLHATFVFSRSRTGLSHISVSTAPRRHRPLSALSRATTGPAATWTQGSSRRPISPTGAPRVCRRDPGKRCSFSPGLLAAPRRPPWKSWPRRSGWL
jgi:hypothetical protein